MQSGGVVDRGLVGWGDKDVVLCSGLGWWVTPCKSP